MLDFYLSDSQSVMILKSSQRVVQGPFLCVSRRKYILKIIVNSTNIHETITQAKLQM